MGRPLIFPEKTQVTVIMANDERTALRNFAKTKGLKVSTLVRNLILDTLKSA